MLGAALGLLVALRPELMEALRAGFAAAGGIFAAALGTGVALAGGFWLLTKTSDTVVHNASAIGTRAGVSPLLLGVGLALLTTLPEQLVTVGAVLNGTPGIGIGNIVGSNIANLLLILSGTAVICAVPAQKADWKFSMAVMGVATLAFAAQLATGRLHAACGILLLCGLAVYLRKLLRDVRESGSARERREREDAAIGAIARGEVEEAPPEHALPPWSNLLFLAAGAAGLVGAAGFSLDAAVSFGRALGVSPAVVGLIAVAVGTSLPEMMVNFKSAMKGETGLAVGNILGSNVFNLVLIGGLLSLTGTAVPPDLNPAASTLGLVNVCTFGGAALLAVFVMAFSRKGITRAHGVAGLFLYAFYTIAAFILGQN